MPGQSKGAGDQAQIATRERISQGKRHVRCGAGPVHQESIYHIPWYIENLCDIPWYISKKTVIYHSCTRGQKCDIPSKFEIYTM
jgi:hypothetical protein